MISYFMAQMEKIPYMFAALARPGNINEFRRAEI